jgi:hypothetical protein
MPLTPSGKTMLFLERGPNRRRSVPRIVGQGNMQYALKTSMIRHTNVTGSRYPTQQA